MYSFVADKDTTKKRDMRQIEGEVQSRQRIIVRTRPSLKNR